MFPFKLSLLAFLSWPSSHPIEDISKASEDNLSWAYKEKVAYNSQKD
jgi:hypothetical protein